MIGEPTTTAQELVTDSVSFLTPTTGRTSHGSVRGILLFQPDPMFLTLSCQESHDVGINPV